MPRKNRNHSHDTTALEALQERYFTSVLKSSLSAVKANNILYTSFVSFIVELQVLFYLFDSRLQKYWIHRSAANTVSFIFAVFNFPEYIFYFAKESTFVFRVPLYLTILVVWIQFLVFVFSMSKHNTKKSKDINIINYIDGMMRFIIGNLFYIPISNILTSLLSCSPKGETELWHHNQDINCISSPGFPFESLLSIFTFVVFLGLIIAQDRFNFSRRIKNQSFSARRGNSGPTVVKVIRMIVVLVMNLRFIKDEKILALFLFQSHFFSFLVLKFSKETICGYATRIYSGIVSIGVWMSFGLVFVVFMGTLIADAIFLFIIGIIGLIAANICKDINGDLRLLSKDDLEATTKETQLVRLEKLTILIERSMNKDQGASVILRGFIDEHQNQCQDVDCPINFWQVYQGEEGYGEYFKGEFSKIKEYVNLEYLRAIRKYPYYFELKISHAYFLMDYANMQNVAFEQIYFLKDKAENSLQSFWQFQANREIDIKNSEKNKTGKGEVQIKSNYVLNQLIHERVISQMKRGLESAATESLFFWQMMLEDTPNIVKVFDALQRILFFINKNQIFWEKNKMVLESSFQAREIYGKYLKEIVDQRETGQKLITESIETAIKQKQEIFQLSKLESNSPIHLYQEPSCIIELNYDDSITVVNCNSGFCALMGYFKEELIGSKLGTLMPQKNVAYFKDLMINSDIGIERVGEYFIFKRKGGFINRYTVDSKLSEDKRGNVFLVMVVRQHKQVGIQSEIVVDSKGKILGNCSTTSLLFNLEGNMKLRSVQIDTIEDLLEVNFTKEIKKILANNTTELQSKILFYDTESEIEMAEEFVNDVPHESQLTGKVIVAANIIKNLVSGENGNPTYCLRLTTTREGEEVSDQLAASTFKHSINMSKIKGGSTFQFSVFKDLSYIGMFASTNKNTKGKASKFASNLNQTGMKQNLFNDSNLFGVAIGGLSNWVKDFKNKVIGSNTDQVIFDYGADVSTKQLRNNVVQDLSDEIEQERKEQRIKEKEKRKKQKVDGNVGTITDFTLTKETAQERKIIERTQNQLTSKTKLNELIRVQPYSGFVKLSIFIIFLYMVLKYMIFGIRVYFTVENRTLSTNTFEFNSIVSLNLNSMHNILDKISSISLMNRTPGAYLDFNPVTIFDRNQLLDHNHNVLQREVREVANRNSLYFEKAGNLISSGNVESFLTESNVIIQKGSANETYSLIEAYKQVTSSALTLIDLEKTAINMNRQESIMIQTNMLDSVQKASEELRKLINEQPEKLKNRNIFVSILLNLIGISIDLIFIGILAVLLFMYFKNIEEICFTFYGFKSSDIEGVILRIDYFLKYLQMSGLDDYNDGDLVIDQNSLDGDEDQALLKKKDEDPFEEILGNAKRRKKNGSLSRKLVPILLGASTLIFFSALLFIYIAYASFDYDKEMLEMYSYLDHSTDFLTTLAIYKSALVGKMMNYKVQVLGKPASEIFLPLNAKMNNAMNDFIEVDFQLSQEKCDQLQQREGLNRLLQIRIQWKLLRV